MSRPLVWTRNLSKRYKLYSRPSDRAREWLSFEKVRRHGDFWALRDFSFEVAQGQCAGLIGSNGAGKSTLLRILGGTLSPTVGTFGVEGRILSLLELGTGFNGELTGRENIVHTAQLLGLPGNYARERMEEIAEFAELGEFLDRPIRIYSTGMRVRLAFSMFAFFDPDVLLVDEVLAVGDVAFQRKCFRRMDEIVRDGRHAVVLVSHDLQAITRLCQTVHWIEQGQMRMSGEPEKVVQEYLRFLFGGDRGKETRGVEGPGLSTHFEERPSPLPSPGVPGEEVREAAGVGMTVPVEGKLGRSSAAIVYHSDSVALLGLWLEDREGRVVPFVSANEPFSICYGAQFSKRISKPLFGFRLATTRGDCLIASNTAMMGTTTGDYDAGQTAIVKWPILPGLAVGDYFVSCGCSLEDDSHHFLMREVDGYQFSIAGKSRHGGLFCLSGQPVIGRQT